jgi:hypothetical protein
MATYFLRFENEAVAQSILEAVDIYVPEIGDNPSYYRQADHGWAFDPIGTITEGGVYDQETGEELIAPTVLEGWHANYVGGLPEGLEDFLVFPENPVRRFAGVD